MRGEKTVKSVGPPLTSPLSFPLLPPRPKLTDGNQPRDRGRKVTCEEECHPYFIAECGVWGPREQEVTEKVDL